MLNKKLIVIFAVFFVVTTCFGDFYTGYVGNNFSNNANRNLNISPAGYIGNKFSNTSVKNENIMPVGFIGNNFSDISIKEENITPVGFIGNNFSSTSVKNENITPVGFLGNILQNNNRKNRAITPIGFFGMYQGQNLIFPEDTIIDTEEKGGGGSAQKETCTPPEKILNINMSLETNGLRKYIYFTWDKIDDNIKLLRTYPYKSKILLERGVSEYKDYIDDKKSSFSYFLISYNDCRPDKYSGLLKIKNLESIKSKDTVYLERDENNIYTRNTDLIEGSNIKITCQLNDSEIINKSISKNAYITIKDRHTNEPFTCMGLYHDLEGDFTETTVFYNSFINGGALTTKEALDIIYGIDNWEENLYFLDFIQKSQTELNYGDFSLILLNKLLDYPINDKNLTLETLKSNGIINQSSGAKYLVEPDDFIEIITYLDDNPELQNSINSTFEKLFSLSRYDFINDLGRVYEINSRLYKLEEESNYMHKILTSCITYKGCSDTSVYYDFINNIEAPKNNSKSNKNISITNYQQYYKELILLYTSISSNNKYSKAEIEKFSNVVFQAITLNLEGLTKEIDYISYLRLQTYLINHDFQKNLDYLVKNHLGKVNEIYEKLADKQKLINILNDFLNN